MARIKNKPTKFKKNKLTTPLKPAKFRKVKAEKKQEERSKQFPNIYRFITEKKQGFLKISKKLNFLNKSISLPYQSKLDKYAKELSVFFTVFAISSLLIGIAILSVDVYSGLKQKRAVELEKKELVSQIELWQSIGQRYSNFRDAFFRLAILEYRIGDFDKAKYYLEKTLVLDPNLKEAEELEKILSQK